jgi:ABC-2 type transport system permease protein
MYVAFAASSFQTALAYRGQVWAQALGYFINISAKVAIWTALFAGQASVDGVSLKQMVTYAIVAGSLDVGWQWERFIQKVGAQIKSGDVAVYLLKPLRYPVMLFSAECGNLGFGLIALIVPVTIISALLYGFVPPPTAMHGLLFSCMWVVGFAILFLLAGIAALLSFWLLTTFALEWMLTALLSILSGRIVPLWFFPEQAAAVLNYLPFAWIAFHPSAVYLGQVDIAGAVTLLAIGLGWVVVLAAIIALLWSGASRRLIVQGG